MDASLKSRTLRDIILPITSLGIFKTLFSSINTEQISEGLNELGNELNLLLFKKSLVHPEYSFSTNAVKPLPARQ
jgi:hypothetical protein